MSEEQKRVPRYDLIDTLTPGSADMVAHDEGGWCDVKDVEKLEAENSLLRREVELYDYKFRRALELMCDATTPHKYERMRKWAWDRIGYDEDEYEEEPFDHIAWARDEARRVRAMQPPRFPAIEQLLRGRRGGDQ